MCSQLSWQIRKQYQRSKSELHSPSP